MVPSRGMGMLLGLGLAIRLWALPFWGTFDVEVQKAWSHRAATRGLADIYGPRDREVLERLRSQGHSFPSAFLSAPFPKTTFEWGTATYFVDYPPGSLLVLWAAGKIYQALDPEMPNRRPFNAVINAAPVVASVVITLLLARAAAGTPRSAWKLALLFWLNPAVMLAVPILGYQDTIFGALALGSVLSLQGGRHAFAWALCVAAGLVKPQGALLLPTLVVVTLKERGLGTWFRAALLSLVTAALILLPWWSTGHVLSALEGGLRPLKQGTLAPLGLNLWWIAGYLMDWAEKGAWPLARIVTIGEFAAWSGWDARIVSRVLLALATGLNVVFLFRSPIEDRRFIPLSAIAQVHAYALLGTSVHENHTFLAVVLAPLLIGRWTKAMPLLVGTSAFLFASLFLAAGFGRRITSQRFLEMLRTLAVLDLSVVFALAHVVLFAVLCLWMVQLFRAPATVGRARVDAKISAH